MRRTIHDNRANIRNIQITIITINTPINRSPKYIKPNLTKLKKKENNEQIMVGNFNLVFNSPATLKNCRTTRQVISKDIENLNSARI